MKERGSRGSATSSGKTRTSRTSAPPATERRDSHPIEPKYHRDGAELRSGYFWFRGEIALRNGSKIDAFNAPIVVYFDDAGEIRLQRCPGCPRVAIYAGEFFGPLVYPPSLLK